MPSQVMKVEYPSKKRDRQTDMDGPIRYSSLTKEREEHAETFILFPVLYFRLRASATSPAGLLHGYTK
jgi:hypothetical protein